MTTTEIPAGTECTTMFGKDLREGTVIYDGNVDAFRTIARIEPGYEGDDHNYLCIYYTDGGSDFGHKGASFEVPVI